MDILDSTQAVLFIIPVFLILLYYRSIPVDAGIADQWIMWHDNVDNKILMCLVDVKIIIECTSGF